MIIKTVGICVYRDTIEEHDEVNNLSYVEVTINVLVQYVRERQSGLFKDLEKFLDEYTADDTEDFYEYAIEHKAVITVENE